MRTVGRRGFSSGMLAFLAAACGGKVAADERSNGVSDAGTARVSDGGPDVLDPGYTPVPPFFDGTPPDVVWSWTTAAQAADVRAGRVLFTVGESPTMGRGYLFEVLQGRARAGDEAAAQLVGDRLFKGRFGWSNPWATARGATDGESYGLELLAIRMKPDTLYARVGMRDTKISFVTAEGEAISTATALGSSDRIGGILFDNDLESGKGCGTLGPIGTAPGGGDLIYREVYLGNEAQIASFSHRTQGILDAIAASRAELVALRTELAASPPPSWRQLQCYIPSLWAGWARPTTALDRYLASLAFATQRYEPTLANLDAMVAELDRARFTPDPFIVTR